MPQQSAVPRSNRRDFIRLSTGAGAAFALSLSSSARGASAKTGSDALPRSAPEENGIASRHILEFVEAMAGDGHELHSLMVLRHGSVIAEGWSQPYAPRLNHSMYSLSKSFTSAAVGFAVAEGALQVTDRVAGFFRDRAPAKISERLARLNIGHLLTMSAGMARTATGATVKERDWVKAFLAQPIEHEPGAVFNYNTAATYMLSAIVQKVSGQGLVAFLKPRLLDRIGITGATWDECPMGVAKGGFGLNINTEGLARFGQLFLQKGRWNDEQVLPASWVKAATSKQIQQGADSNKNPDWQQGYGYQFWRCRHNCYRGDGAFGQFIIVLPEKDAVVVLTSETRSMQGELDLVWEHLLPNFSSHSITRDQSVSLQIPGELGRKQVPFPKGSNGFKRTGKWMNRKLTFPDNPAGIDSMTLRTAKGFFEFAFASRSHGDWTLRGHWRRWTHGTAPMLTAQSWLISRGRTDERGWSRTAVSLAWQDKDTATIVVRYNETPHHDILTVRFDDSGATLEILDSVSLRRNPKAKPRFSLRGTYSA